jgi:hypothetical protein
MSWVAVDKYGDEILFSAEPFRMGLSWCSDEELAEQGQYDGQVLVPGTILELIGRALKWEDEPAELQKG